MLLCGIKAYSRQRCCCIFILCYNHLKLELLPHKTVLVMFLLASTVNERTETETAAGRGHGRSEMATGRTLAATNCR